MSHVREEELVLYAAQPDAIDRDRRAEIEGHLASCAECQDRHDFFAILDEDLDTALREPDTWEPMSPTPTYESLMEHGARIAEEDRDAEILLKDFLANPMQTAWTTTIARTRRYRTGGVVRKLNAAAQAIYKSKPRVALTFADAAISVAEALPDKLYPAQGVYRLRGTAWKERANAQTLLGEFEAAHESLDRAENAYEKIPRDPLGPAIVALIRAGVFYEQTRLDEAMVMAERAERGFWQAGDEKRRMDAAFMRASIIFEAGDPRRALPIFQRIIEYGENAQSAQSIAVGSYAAANCELDLGNLGEASVLFLRALRTFRERGPERERLLTEWGIARVVLHGGNFPEAIRRLRDVAAEFERRGMVTNAALVGLDVSEALLALDRPADIVKIAQHLFSVFTNAGMLTGALSALAYLKEAAATNRLTKRDVAVIRTFLRRAERQPSLAFVPPPRPPEDSV